MKLYIFKQSEASLTHDEQFKSNWEVVLSYSHKIMNFHSINYKNKQKRFFTVGKVIFAWFAG